MKENFTILIQGPLNEASLQNISNYLKYGKEVIISHWNSDNLELIKKYQQENVKFISQDLKQNIPSCCDFKPLYWMLLSTYYGLQFCNTKYTIKVRSDEFFSNLSYLIEIFLNDDDKIVHGNIFAQKYSDHPYHFGDHLFVAKTSLLLNSHRDIVLMYDQYNLTKTIDPAYQLATKWCPEQILSSTIFRQRGIYTSKQNILPKEIIQKYVEIIDINKLGQYKVRWNHMKKEWNNNYRNENGVNSIKDIF